MQITTRAARRSAIGAACALAALALAGGASASTFPLEKPVRAGAPRPIAYLPISFAGERALRPKRIVALAKDVRARYLAESQGRVRLTGLRSRSAPGDVLPVIRIPATIDRCDDFSVSYHAIDRTRRALARYAHVVVLYPGFTNCAWGGRAGMPGAVVTSMPDANVLLHEIGHNIGLDHARSLECGASSGYGSSFGRRCGGNEYGDLYDSMGGTQGGFSAWERAAVGLLPRTRGRAVRATGRYQLALPDATAGTLFLRVRRAGAQTPDRSGLCLERARSADTQRVGDRDGLVVRLCAPLPKGTGTRFGLPGTWLVDASPDDSTRQLDLGGVLEDSAGRIRVRLDALGEGRAVVSIAVDGDALPVPAVVPAAPVLTATGAVQETGGELPDARDVFADLAWTQPPGAIAPSAYHVLRDGHMVAVLASTETTWRDPAPIGPGAQVRYRVRAVAEGGGRAASAIVVPAPVTLPGQPPQPTGVAVAVRSRTGTLSWRALPGNPPLRAWEVEEDGSFSGTTTAGRRRYPFVFIPASGVRRVRVRAIASDGTPGPWSATVVARTAPELEGVIRRPHGSGPIHVLEG